jgi:hypothetical protein
MEGNMENRDVILKEYLLAAEADKIQDLIFRSSFLREVVGGSQLLTDFCRKVPNSLWPEMVKEDDIVSSDAGSFRILFDRLQDATEYGYKLAELYRHTTGGSLTVASPVATKGGFLNASEEAMIALREAKQDRRGRTAVQQIPYIAFCASCGIGLADEHRKLDEDLDVEPQYLCRQCAIKAKQRETAGVGSFLKPFYDQIKAPDKRVQKIPTPEDIAGLDARNYVAYIVADANGMGEVFGKCQEPSLMKRLSSSLTPTLQRSLAVPAEILMTHQQMGDFQEKQNEKFIPVLPLVLGGDDMFVLLPAPWALDFALRFGRAYESMMEEKTEEIFGSASTLSISIAVVICKATYPYYLAHRRGEYLLTGAKQMGKRFGIENDTHSRSTITFEVILGNRIAEGEGATSENRPTLKPYWMHEAPEGWGLPLQTLIEQRLALSDLPRKRLSEFREIFDLMPARQPKNNDERKQFRGWLDRIDKLTDRIAFREIHGQKATDVLEVLGGRKLCHVTRATDLGEWYGHGLPDLIEAWDFALDLGQPSSAYEGGNL